MNKKFKENILLIGLLSAIISTNIYVSVPNLDLISKEFMISDFLVSIISGSFFFFYGVSAVVWGYLIDALNINRRKGLYVAVLAVILFDTLAGISPSPYVLLLANILIGISLGFSIPALYGIIIDYFPLEDRIFAIAIWNLLSSLGSSTGYAISFASGYLLNWRVAFLIVAGTQSISFLALRFIREPKKGESESILKEIYEKGRNYNYRLNERDFLDTILRKTNYFLILQSFFISAGWGAYMGWGIHFMTREVGLNKVQAAAILGLVGLGGASSLIMAKFVQRFQNINLRFKLFIAGFFVAFEGTSYIIMYSILKFIHLSIADGDMLQSVIILLSTIASNSLLALSILLGALGNFMGSTAGPIRGTVVSEVNLPEEKSALYGVLIVSDHVGRSLGIVLVGSISFIFGSLYLGLIVSFSLYYIGSLSWFKATKTYMKDREKFIRVLNHRKEEILSKRHNSTNS